MSLCHKFYCQVGEKKSQNKRMELSCIKYSDSYHSFIYSFVHVKNHSLNKGQNNLLYIVPFVSCNIIIKLLKTRPEIWTLILVKATPYRGLSKWVRRIVSIFFPLHDIGTVSVLESKLFYYMFFTSEFNPDSWDLDLWFFYFVPDYICQSFFLIEIFSFCLFWKSVQVAWIIK